MEKTLSRSYQIAMYGMLTAVSVVLSRFCVIYLTESIRIEFGNLPILLAGILGGPLAGAVVGGMADVVGGCFLSSSVYFPPLTLTPMLVGFFAGLLGRTLLQRPTVWKALLLTGLTNTAGKFLWTTLCLYLLYGTPLPALLAARAPLCILMAILEGLVIYKLIKGRYFERYIQRRDGL